MVHYLFGARTMFLLKLKYQRTYCTKSVRVLTAYNFTITLWDKVLKLAQVQKLNTTYFMFAWLPVYFLAKRSIYNRFIIAFMIVFWVQKVLVPGFLFEILFYEITMRFICFSVKCFSNNYNESDVSLETKELPTIVCRIRTIRDNIGICVKAAPTPGNTGPSHFMWIIIRCR